MENKLQTDVHLRAMLNSPARFTPAVPTPDWTAPPSQTVAPPATTPTIKNNASNMTVATPGSAIGEPHTNITLQNCVATVDLHTPLDLAMINARTRNTEYNPARFHGVIMRLREPRTTALIFRSGKIICTGARNEHDSLLASKKFARIVQKLGFNFTAKINSENTSKFIICYLFIPKIVYTINGQVISDKLLCSG
ncbi:hypothetical protein NQ314_021192 [Rhamnusium bicolor]|uniref:TATA-box-binding protein n=1 Tax=Rhamnusium bicolor TaxID=1586634 RepID=A0AAV8WJH0_9CUCU|nr:hypothetical protein NQ314_021192 [Rhamnusium bicolor]